MKKVVIFAVAFLAIAAHAQAASDFKILELRNRFFDESKQVKDLLGASKDPAVLVSMYNSCVLSITQMDAYFSMLGIFESVEGKALTVASLDPIINWLYEIKRTNALNISTLDSMLRMELTPDTKSHLAKLKSFYAESSMRADADISKLNTIKRTVKPAPPVAVAIKTGPAQDVKQKK